MIVKSGQGNNLTTAEQNVVSWSIVLIISISEDAIKNYFNDDFELL